MISKAPTEADAAAGAAWPWPAVRSTAPPSVPQRLQAWPAQAAASLPVPVSVPPESPVPPLELRCRDLEPHWASALPEPLTSHQPASPPRTASSRKRARSYASASPLRGTFGFEHARIRRLAPWQWLRSVRDWHRSSITGRQELARSPFDEARVHRPHPRDRPLRARGSQRWLITRGNPADHCQIARTASGVNVTLAASLFHSSSALASSLDFWKL